MSDPPEFAADELDEPVEPAAAAVAAEIEPAGEPEMIIGVRIREASRMYHFAAPWNGVFAGDYVVINRGRGEQMARVVTVPEEQPTASIPRDVRPIERIADADDRESARASAERADAILADMRRIVVRGEMRFYPVAVELNLLGDRGTAWFESADHVDYRDLLEEVQADHHVELTMQKANQRERAMLVDGYDVCGLRLCCASWMTDFPQVGIRVAKDQDLPLNPDSISGVCGRLLCCLTFEHEVYREMRGTLPKVGKRVSTPAGMGKVVKLNVLQQRVTISLDDHPQRVDVPVEEIGLAVRTEEAPNEALIEAERARDLRRAAAPPRRDGEESSEDRPRRRRRRGRASSDSGDADAPTQERSSRDRAEEGSESGQRPRRRRRRKPKVVNQQSDGSQTDSAATAPASEGDARRPRRRRRRSKRPVDQSDSPPASE